VQHLFFNLTVDSVRGGVGLCIAGCRNGDDEEEGAVAEKELWHATSPFQE
jgi:hypothetical protein